MSGPLAEQDTQDVQAFQQQMIGYYDKHGRDLPWRDTASDSQRPHGSLLEQTSPREVCDFHVLSALIMLQRTSVGQVSNVFPTFCEQYPTPAVVLDAPDAELEDLLAPLGLLNRTQYLRNVAQFFTTDDEATQEHLLQIGGVGRYTANAFLSIHKQERYPIVDVNVERVFDHCFDTQEQDYWELAETLLPEKEVRAYNLGLLDYGTMLRRES